MNDYEVMEDWELRRFIEQQERYILKLDRIPDEEFTQRHQDEYDAAASMLSMAKDERDSRKRVTR